MNAVRLIAEAECRELTGLARTTRWRLEKAGKFPKRIAVSARAARWRHDEVLAWIEAVSASGRSQGCEQ